MFLAPLWEAEGKTVFRGTNWNGTRQLCTQLTIFSLASLNSSALSLTVHPSVDDLAQSIRPVGKTGATDGKITTHPVDSQGKGT